MAEFRPTSRTKSQLAEIGPKLVEGGRNQDEFAQGMATKLIAFSDATASKRTLLDHILRMGTPLCAKQSALLSKQCGELVERVRGWLADERCGGRLVWAGGVVAPQLHIKRAACRWEYDIINSSQLEEVKEGREEADVRAQEAAHRQALLQGGLLHECQLRPVRHGKPTLPSAEQPLDSGVSRGLRDSGRNWSPSAFSADAEGAADMPEKGINDCER